MKNMGILAHKNVKHKILFYQIFFVKIELNWHKILIYEQQEIANTLKTLETNLCWKLVFSHSINNKFNYI